MKLSSTPKPVRIRISVNNKYHSEVESLKKDITPEVLTFLDDDRLLRWLKQQGKNEMAEKIKAISLTDNKTTRLLKLYDAIFELDTKCLDCYVDKWNSKEDEIKASALVKFLCKNRSNDISFYKNLLDNRSGLLEPNYWYELMETIDDEEFNHQIVNKFMDKWERQKTFDLCNCVYIGEETKILISNYCRVLRRAVFTDTSDNILKKVIEDWKYIEKIYIPKKSKVITREEDIRNFIRICAKINWEHKYSFIDNLCILFKEEGGGIVDLKSEVNLILSLRDPFYNCCKHPLCKLYKSARRHIDDKAVIKEFISEIIRYILFEKYKQ